MTTWNEIKAHFLYKKRRYDSRQTRISGDPDSVMHGDWRKKTFTCGNCGSQMEFWKEDYMGDWIYSCTNQFCFKSKDYAGSLTVELKKLAKQQQMNSRLYYRTYLGGYY